MSTSIIPTAKRTIESCESEIQQLKRVVSEKENTIDILLGEINNPTKNIMYITQNGQMLRLRDILETRNLVHSEDMILVDQMIQYDTLDYYVERNILDGKVQLLEKKIRVLEQKIRDTEKWSLNVDTSYVDIEESMKHLYRGDAECEDGGTMCMDEDGAVYVGKLNQGKRWGKGRLVYGDGRVVEGEFLNGMKHGVFSETMDGVLEGKGEYRYGKKCGMWVEKVGKDMVYRNYYHKGKGSDGVQKKVCEDHVSYRNMSDTTDCAKLCYFFKKGVVHAYSKNDNGGYDKIVFKKI